ncbi:hypothetical protein BSKO_14009 [Bryopsis sp. KO-2023]|nr:hypothetical protein BSKO_14009 [Bryopsis sp. KO-2023]
MNRICSHRGCQRQDSKGTSTYLVGDQLNIALRASTRIEAMDAKTRMRIPTFRKRHKLLSLPSWREILLCSLLYFSTCSLLSGAEPYEWVMSEWTECSVECAGGTHTRLALCRDQSDPSNVFSGDCPGAGPAPDSVGVCNLQPCETFEWSIGEWIGCEDCGSGSRTRDVLCNVSNGTVLNDATEIECYDAGTKPITTEPCPTFCSKFGYRWTITAIGECSQSCGGGVRQSSVMCQSPTGDLFDAEAQTDCPNAGLKPDLETSCNNHDCSEVLERGFEWLSTSWGECSVECGGGTRERMIWCQSPDGGIYNAESENSCPGAGKKPLSFEECNTAECIFGIEDICDGCDPECIDRVYPHAVSFTTADGALDAGHVLGGILSWDPLEYASSAHQTRVSISVQMTFRCSSTFWIKCPDWPATRTYKSGLYLEFGTQDRVTLNSMEVVGVSHELFFVAEERLEYTYDQLTTYKLRVSGGKTPVLNNFDPPRSLPFQMSVEVDLSIQLSRMTKNRPPQATSPTYISAYALDGGKNFTIASRDLDGDNMRSYITNLERFGVYPDESFSLPPGLSLSEDTGRFDWSTKVLLDEHRGLWFIPVTVGDLKSDGSCCRGTTVVVFPVDILGYHISGVRRYPVSEFITVGRCDLRSDIGAPVTCGQWAYPGERTLQGPSRLFVQNHEDGVFTDAFLKFASLSRSKERWTNKGTVEGWMKLKQLSKRQIISSESAQLNHAPVTEFFDRVNNIPIEAANDDTWHGEPGTETLADLRFTPSKKDYVVDMTQHISQWSTQPWPIFGVRLGIEENVNQGAVFETEGVDAPLMTLCTPDILTRNNPPKIEVVAPQSEVCTGDSLSISIECSDVDGDLVNIILIGNMPWSILKEVGANQWSLILAPDIAVGSGIYSFTLMCGDGLAHSMPVSIPVDVTSSALAYATLQWVETPLPGQLDPIHVHIVFDQPLSELAPESLTINGGQVDGVVMAGFGNFLAKILPNSDVNVISVSLKDPGYLRCASGLSSNSLEAKLRNVDLDQRRVSLISIPRNNDTSIQPPEQGLDIDTCLSRAARVSANATEAWFLIHPSEYESSNVYQIVSTTRMEDDICEKQFLAGMCNGIGDKNASIIMSEDGGGVAAWEIDTFGNEEGVTIKNVKCNLYLGVSTALELAFLIGEDSEEIPLWGVVFEDSGPQVPLGRKLLQFGAGWERGFNTYFYEMPHDEMYSVSSALGRIERESISPAVTQKELQVNFLSKGADWKGLDFSKYFVVVMEGKMVVRYAARCGVKVDAFDNRDLLGGEYGLAGDISTIPNLDSMTAASTLYLASVDLPSIQDAWEGFPFCCQFSIKMVSNLYVPATDTYEFFLTSNDGSKLYIDGNLRAVSSSYSTFGNAGPVPTCKAQLPCLQFDIGQCDNGMREVCMYWDANAPGCIKEKDISHSCVAGSYQNYGWPKGRSSAICQSVSPGSTAEFGVKDGQGCDTGGGGIVADFKQTPSGICTNVFCEAPRSSAVCNQRSQGQAGEECKWKVYVPTCDGENDQGRCSGSQRDQYTDSLKSSGHHGLKLEWASRSIQREVIPFKALSPNCAATGSPITQLSPPPPPPPLSSPPPPLIITSPPTPTEHHLGIVLEFFSIIDQNVENAVKVLTKSGTEEANEYLQSATVLEILCVKDINFQRIGRRSAFPLTTRSFKENYMFRARSILRIPQSGEWSFQLASDDGSALFLDGKLVLDYWTTHSMRTKTANAGWLDGGFVPMDVYFFQKYGSHGIILRWKGPNFPTWTVIDESFFSTESSSCIPAPPPPSPPPSPPPPPPITFPPGSGHTGLHEQFWRVDGRIRNLPDDVFDTSPDFSRCTPYIYYTKKSNRYVWAHIPEPPEWAKESFVVSLSGYIDFPRSGDWTLKMGSDDGSVLWLDDVKIIDMNRLQGLRYKSATKTIPQGWHKFEIRYFQNYGHHGLILAWRGPQMQNYEVLGTESYFTENCPTPTPPPTPPPPPPLSPPPPPFSPPPFMPPPPVTLCTFQGVTAKFYEAKEYSVDDVWAILDGNVPSFTSSIFEAAASPWGETTYTQIDNPEVTSPSFWQNHPAMPDGSYRTIFFMVKFEGRITIPASGFWTIYVASNDGSFVEIDGSRIVSNPCCHILQEESATVWLSAGTFSLLVS